MSAPRKKLLVCSCCGRHFRGIQPSSDDAGFGTCPTCATWIAQKEEEQERRYIAQFARFLNKSNRRAFLHMDRELQRAFVHKAVEDGNILKAILSRPTKTQRELENPPPR